MKIKQALCLLVMLGVPLNGMLMFDDTFLGDFRNVVGCFYREEILRSFQQFLEASDAKFELYSKERASSEEIGSNWQTVVSSVTKAYLSLQDVLKMASQQHTSANASRTQVDDSLDEPRIVRFDDNTGLSPDEVMQDAYFDAINNKKVGLVKPSQIARVTRLLLGFSAEERFAFKCFLQGLSDSIPARKRTGQNSVEFEWEEPFAGLRELVTFYHLIGALESFRDAIAQGAQYDTSRGKDVLVTFKYRANDIARAYAQNHRTTEGFLLSQREETVINAIAEIKDVEQWQAIEHYISGFQFGLELQADAAA